MRLPDVKQLVREHFAELHSKEGTHIFLLNCYVANKQSIDRKQKMTLAQKRKSKFTVTAIPKSVPASSLHNAMKMKSMSIKAIMKK
jgi:hypothetical protein